MALTPNDRKIIDDFRDTLTDRFITDYEGTTTPAARERLADARRKMKAIANAEAEYEDAVFAAERAALWQTGQLVHASAVAPSN